MPTSFTYNISFNDPNGTYSALYTQLANAIGAAADGWRQYLGSTAASSLDIVVAFDPTLQGDPNSPGVNLTTSSAAYIGSANGLNLYELGPAPKLLTGVDPNGPAADLVLTFNPQLVANQLWFDPSPTVRTAPMPADKIDAESLLLRLMGNAYAFNGFLNPSTGRPASNYESAFDRYVTSSNGNFFFTGPHAQAVYGGPVPLTNGSYTHLGNGSTLLSDVMNGAGINPGTRYSVSALDAAILQDYIAPVTNGSSPSGGIGGNGSVAPIGAASIGVFRFFDTVYGTHFYTESDIEAAQLRNTRSDLRYEGVGLHAINPANNDPTAVQVYRFFDKINGTHFYTYDIAERDNLVATRSDLKLEGPSFYEHVTQQPGDSAVYRFFDTIHGTHFYTADEGERANVAATRSDLRFEGVSFYAPST